jgi:hypothetical protein
VYRSCHRRPSAVAAASVVAAGTVAVASSVVATLAASAVAVVVVAVDGSSSAALAHPLRPAESLAGGFSVAVGVRAASGIRRLVTLQRTSRALGVSGTARAVAEVRAEALGIWRFLRYLRTL